MTAADVADAFFIPLNHPQERRLFCIALDGAFYVYADISSLTNDSEIFCRRMLDETGVAATPGTDFDQGRGNAYVRFSFSGPTAVIAKAVERLKHWTAKTG